MCVCFCVIVWLCVQRCESCVFLMATLPTLSYFLVFPPNSATWLLWWRLFSRWMSTRPNCSYWRGAFWSNEIGYMPDSGFWVLELLRVRHLIMVYGSHTRWLVQYILMVIFYITLIITCRSVLEVLDRRCSGRQNCNFLVSLLNEFRRFCTKQLPGYLQARYTCQSGQ